MAVWRGAGRYEARARCGAWIWGIGIRRLIARSASPAEAVGDPHRRELVASAEDQVLLGVEHGDLGTALGRLSPELRAVVQATVLDGLTTSEAGRCSGSRRGRSRRDAARARRELREELA